METAQRVRPGLAGAQARWKGHDSGEVRVKLQNLSMEQRAIVKSLIQAAASFNPTQRDTPVIEPSGVSLMTDTRHEPSSE